jgi:hypothetical protein
VINTFTRTTAPAVIRPIGVQNFNYLQATNRKLRNWSLVASNINHSDGIFENSKADYSVLQELKQAYSYIDYS